MLTGPHEEIARLQLSLDPLTILLPSKILTWCWSTLGIAGFFFEVAMRHQNKVEPLSLLDVLCVTLERNVGIRHLVVLMGITQRHLNVILQIYLTPEHGTKHLVLLFHCPSSVVEKKVTCISDVSLNSRGILHFISIYYFLVASETNESSKVSSVWVVTK